MTAKRTKLLKSDFIVLGVFTWLKDYCIDLFGWQFQETVERKLNDFAGNIYIKFTYEHRNIYHACMRTKSRLNLKCNVLLKRRLNTKPKMSQKNENILKCKTKKRKRKKKVFEIVIFHATRRNIHWLVRKCQTSQFIIPLFFRWNFDYGATPVEKSFIQCDKIYLKSQYSAESKALNLIPDN